MIDIAPAFVFLALVGAPALVARFVTGGEPVDLPRLVATVLAAPPDPLTADVAPPGSRS